MPAISVVIPVYNAAPYLREALDSLLRQTCGDFEAIVVNDGSTDNSLEILQEYAARDSRIRILDGPNGGYGKAMNRGMDAATGKYMAILEPDDYLPREAYATLLPLAEEHRLDVVRGAYCDFYEEDGQKHFAYQMQVCRPEILLCPRKQLPGVFESAPAIWSGLYRLAFLKQHEIRFHESPGASYQDAGFFFLTAVYAERYMLTEEVAYFYRTDNPNSSINTMGSKKFALLAEYAYVRRQLERVPEIWKVVEKQFMANCRSGVSWVLSRLSAADKMMFFAELDKWLAGCEVEILSEPERLVMESEMRETSGGQLQINEPQMKVARTMLGGLVRMEMSRDFTGIYVLNMPVLTRRLLPKWRMLRSGIEAECGMENEYRFLGIRVNAREVDVYAIWPRRSEIPVRFK